MTPGSVAVYTALFGGYDRLLEQADEPNVDFVCFTDDPERTSETWQIREVVTDESPRRAARRLKTSAHDALDDYEWTIWVDARLSIRSPEFVPTMLASADRSGMAVIAHRERHCAYDEAAEVYRKGFDTSDSLIRQVRRYRHERFPAGRGLYSTMVIARRNHDPRVRELDDRWQAEIDAGSMRDQVSLPYVTWLLGFEPTVVDLEPMRNDLYVMHHHNEPRRYPAAWRQHLNATRFALTTRFGGRPVDPG
jgi:hypothetical protein